MNFKMTMRHVSLLFIISDTSKILPYTSFDRCIDIFARSFECTYTANRTFVAYHIASYFRDRLISICKYPEVRQSVGARGSVVG
jgi:hypothetical protein